ncbi:Mkk2p [Rhizophagus irregularis DAOM 197198w]|uniref:Mkk2p n=1 Tax=Rhizophagus irregularis (strain DAOM 197198w) TaxID=1432141 RepID=A0A015J8L5_RHIIW|nr:Mkk2p [Rhizophagus irregularis DAOM 197198w]
MVLHIEYFKGYCIKCDEKYTSINYEWCKQCQRNNLTNNFTEWTSGNKKVDAFIQEMQLKINNIHDIIFEWIPYNHFNDIKKIDKGGFAVVYSAIWKDGPLSYYKIKNEWIRESNKKVALKCLNNSQNISDEFLNEVKAYSINNFDKILRIWNITKSKYKRLHHGSSICRRRKFNHWINKNYKYFCWTRKLKVLNNIINGLKGIHQKQMIHCDFHTGNILFEAISCFSSNYISDMGLCGEIGNIDKKNIYGVMPYIAPELLRGNPYTQAADVYSFSMIMYSVATEIQPFNDRAHDENLALDICKSVRPEINELEIPKCYINLMKRCWDSNPDNRPNVTEIEKSIYNLNLPLQKDREIYKQFLEAESYRKANKKRQLSAHPQAFYTSRLLNLFTKDLPKYIDDNDLSSKITINNEDNYNETIPNTSLDLIHGNLRRGNTLAKSE